MSKFIKNPRFETLTHTKIGSGDYTLDQGQTVTHETCLNSHRDQLTSLPLMSSTIVVTPSSRRNEMLYFSLEVIRIP